MRTRPLDEFVVAWDLNSAASVRLVLLASKGDKFPFLRDAVASFADVDDVVEDLDVESSFAVAAARPNIGLVIVARGRWQESDTQLCARISAMKLAAPLLCVSGPCAPSDRASALKAGADDFLSVPFDIEELAARAIALVRRASSAPGQVRAGAFVVDIGRRQVLVDGQSIPLTLHEFDILAMLIEHQGETVTRSDLAARASSSAGPDSNVVDVHVSRIREKLGDRAGALQTVRGVGYRLRV
jgi:DNA-binding response OmpR family regulator